MELLLIFHAAFCHSKLLFIVKKPVYKAPTIFWQMKMHIILVAVPQLLAQPLPQWVETSPPAQLSLKQCMYAEIGIRSAAKQ